MSPAAGDAVAAPSAGHLRPSLWKTYLSDICKPIVFAVSRKPELADSSGWGATEAPAQGGRRAPAWFPVAAVPLVAQQPPIEARRGFALLWEGRARGRGARPPDEASRGAPTRGREAVGTRGMELLLIPPTTTLCEQMNGKHTFRKKNEN